MAILNITPDSFSDGGLLTSIDAVVAQARTARDEGAVILDVGGESTRPQAAAVDEAEELRRVIPVIDALRDRVGLPISIDTTKASVFREAYLRGASMLNDVSGLSLDPEMGAALAATDAAAVLMHRRGTPATMQSLATYADVGAEVAAELAACVGRAEAAGVPRDRLILDPGIGFAKVPSQNFELLRRLDELRVHRLPLCVGPSRKAFLGAVTGRTVPRERDAATAVVVAACAAAGVELVRVHHPGYARDAVAVANALKVGIAP